MKGGREKRRENLLTAVSKLMEGWMDGRMQIEREGGMWSDFPSFLASLLTYGWAWLAK